MIGTLAALCLVTGAMHDGPDPIVAWDLAPRHQQNGSLKARIGPDARVMGAPKPAETALGQCLVLDGRNDWFLVSSDLDSVRRYLPKRTFTVEAWAAVNMGQNDGSFLGVLQDNGSYEKGWSLGYNGKAFTFALSTVGANDGDGRLTYLEGKTPYVVGKIYHVVGVYNGTKMRLYVNGQLDAESTVQSGDILYPDDAVWALGCYKDKDEEYPLEGRLVEVALYDLAATDAAVKHLYEHKRELAEAAPAIQENPKFEWVVKPYQQSPRPDGITIMWETTRPGSSVVFAGPSKADLKRFEGTSARNPQSLVHRVDLRGLSPESHYVFRAESTDDLGRKLESPLLTFRTAPQGERAIRFTVVGDTQDQPAVNKRIAEHMWNERPDFFMIVGDLVGTGANKRHWVEHFFGSMRPLLDRIPLIPVLGNHEGDARLYYDYMAVPDPEYWYRFTYGPAEFFIVDSNRNMEKGSEQFRWLDAALGSSKARWKFVAHHHPPFSSDEDDFGNLWEGQSTRGDVRLMELVSLYEKHRVDVVWTGHIHSYERTWPILRGEASANGPIYIVCGGGGGGLERHGPTRPEFSNRIRHGHHYCVVSIHGNIFEMSAFDIEGRMFDHLRLQKR